jgi:hypothetical protein
MNKAVVAYLNLTECANTGQTSGSVAQTAIVTDRKKKTHSKRLNVISVI